MFGRKHKDCPYCESYKRGFDNLFRDWQAALGMKAKTQSQLLEAQQEIRILNKAIRRKNNHIKWLKQSSRKEG